MAATSALLARTVTVNSLLPELWEQFDASDALSGGVVGALLRTV
jgi:hypothetical protein